MSISLGIPIGPVVFCASVGVQLDYLTVFRIVVLDATDPNNPGISILELGLFGFWLYIGLQLAGKEMTGNAE